MRDTYYSPENWLQHPKNIVKSKLDITTPTWQLIYVPDDVLSHRSSAPMSCRRVRRDPHSLVCQLTVRKQMTWVSNFGYCHVCARVCMHVCMYVHDYACVCVCAWETRKCMCAMASHHLDAMDLAPPRSQEHTTGQSGGWKEVDRDRCKPWPPCRRPSPVHPGCVLVA